MGTLDALLSLAEVAKLPGYVRPAYHPVPPANCSPDTPDASGTGGVEARRSGEGGDGADAIVLRGARHPTVERVLEGGFVPNDVDLK